MTNHITKSHAWITDASLFRQFYRGNEIAPVYTPGFAESLAHATQTACREADKAGYRAVCVLITTGPGRRHRDVFVKRGGVWQPATWLYGKWGKVNRDDPGDLWREDPFWHVPGERTP